MKRCAVLLGLLVGVLFSPRASGQARDRAREAEAAKLFSEARALESKGLLEEACARFEASERLDPAVGTLLNLAECAMQRGATATAWSRLRQAAAVAMRKGDADREAVALRKSAALEPRLSKLVVRAPSGRPLPPSATVWRDDQLLPESELGSPIPLDPGEHRVTCKAPGFSPWSVVLRISPGPGVAEVELPTLAPDTEPSSAPRPSPGSPRSQAASSSASVPPASRAPGAASPGSAVRTIAWATGGVAVVPLAIGGFFALRARSLWSDVEQGCPDGLCPDPQTLARQERMRDEAADDAGRGTVALAIGAAAVATAVVLWVLSGSSRSPRTSLLPGGRF